MRAFKARKKERWERALADVPEEDLRAATRVLDRARLILRGGLPAALLYSLPRRTRPNAPTGGSVNARRAGRGILAVARDIVTADGELESHSPLTGPSKTAARMGPRGPFFCPPRTGAQVKKHPLRYQNDAQKIHTGEHPQHRDHGAHRRRQDDDDRAHPLLHRPHLQARRGARGRGHDGLDGAGAGARHHDHLGRHHRAVEGPPHQHHRHPRPRGLHGRGRALAARARRRDRALRLGRRRGAAVRDRLAPGRQVRRAAHRLHQQDGPRRRQLRAGRADDDRPPRRAPRADPAADRRRGRLRRRRSTWCR